MKCKICGHRSNSIKSMGEHYRKKHPSSMKRQKKDKEVLKGHKYCPSCGHKLE